MNSIISHSVRGNYGKSSYRGNCSGYVIKDLIEHFRPASFVDCTEGGGTSRDVCKELGVKYFGLDLHTGFDVTRDSVLKAIGGNPVPMVFSHPPYHTMIQYEKEREKHNLTGSGNDLSACASPEEFLEKAQLMLLNQREATKRGGIYTTLIGDYRKDGSFYSFQSDFIKMMPTSELLSVVIKAQHNTHSDFKSYSSTATFIPIKHEYLLIWKRNHLTMAQVAWNKASEFTEALQMTWRNHIRQSLMELGGTATLDEIYRQVEAAGADKIKSNPNYRAKVRQQLQMYFNRVDKGVWSLN